MKTHREKLKMQKLYAFFNSTAVDACFSPKMSCVVNTVHDALVIYRRLFMLCGKSEVRTVWSPNLGTYLSMSVFVSVPASEADTW